MCVEKILVGGNIMDNVLVVHSISVCLYDTCSAVPVSAEESRNEAHVSSWLHHDAVETRTVPRRLGGISGISTSVQQDR